MKLTSVLSSFQIEPLLLLYRITEKPESTKKNCEHFVSSQGVTVTSSGRKVKHACYVETRISSPTYSSVKKRKNSGGASKCAKKTKIDGLDANESYSKMSSRNKDSSDRHTERNIFDLINGSADEQEVPHIAIKISKTGDTKDAWCSQPCQIMTPTSNRVTGKIRSMSSESTTITRDQIHGRASLGDLEEDSGRGSDVSSPSLLSPSSVTDLSPPPPPPRQEEYASHKIRTKSTSSASPRHETHHRHGSGSNSLPNSPCHDARDEILLDLASKVEKSHRKRSHKYNSLSVSVMGADISLTANGHYANAIASIPSPENPLLMKITRQVSHKPNFGLNHSTSEPEEDSKPNKSSADLSVSKCESPTPLDPHHPLLSSDKLNVSVELSVEDRLLETCPDQINQKSEEADVPVLRTVDDQPPKLSLEKGEETKPIDVEQMPPVLEEQTIRESASVKVDDDDAKEQSIGHSSCSDKLSNQSTDTRDVARSTEPVLLESSASRPTTKTESQTNEQFSTRVVNDKQNNAETSASEFGHLTCKKNNFIMTNDNISISTCRRVKPYVARFRRSASITSLPSAAGNDGRVSSPDGVVDCTTVDIRRPKKLHTLAMDLVPMSAKLSKISTMRSPLQRSLDHDLKSLPGLRIPRFIPQATWYNLPPPPVSHCVISSNGCLYSRPGHIDAPTGELVRQAGLSVSVPISGNKDTPLSSAIRHKTPQQVKRPVVVGQPMVRPPMLRPPMLIRAMSHLGPPGPTMPALWRFPGFPPYTTPSHK